MPLVDTIILLFSSKTICLWSNVLKAIFSMHGFSAISVKDKNKNSASCKSQVALLLCFNRNSIRKSGKKDKYFTWSLLKNTWHPHSNKQWIGGFTFFSTPVYQLSSAGGINRWTWAKTQSVKGTPEVSWKCNYSEKWLFSMIVCRKM